ncbi:MAG TPA: hypothetical protein VFT39_13310 [Vicinamibacterales bacterium]|nr:hypothetical protein [Vicinamibacterales bacterium]
MALLAELPEEARAAIAPQAMCLAACVAPDRAFALRATTTDPFGNEKFLVDMVCHGHVTAAVDYLTQWSEDGEFPCHAAFETISATKDNDTRRDILRSGLRAWHRRADSTCHSFVSLLQLFRFHWRLLPEDEARDAVRSLVGIMRERPDERLNGGFGGPHGTVTFSSYRPSLLFELLGPLKRLDSELADAVIGENRELRRAADIYPFGHDTEFDRPVDQPSAEALEQWKRNWTGFALGSQFFRIEDERNGDFKNSFEHALRSYARDADRARPNPYPRECWPSAEDFRVILYAAGRYDGEGGARLLDRIPDVVLRLFAEIEFAAGIAGLAQIGSITREQLRGH